MYVKFIMVALGLSFALLTLQSAAAVEMRSLERSFESSTEVRIPAGDNAPLAMQHCPSCPVVTLRISPHTRYFIGDEQVTQAEFRAAAARETISMTVFYEPESKVVTRVTIRPN